MPTKQDTKEKGGEKALWVHRAKNRQEGKKKKEEAGLHKKNGGYRRPISFEFPEKRGGIKRKASFLIAGESWRGKENREEGKRKIELVKKLALLFLKKTTSA